MFENVVENIDEWLDTRRRNCDMVVHRSSINESSSWLCDNSEIKRQDGAFFRVIGIEGQGQTVSDNFVQPIIDQPEVGILGFIINREERRPRILVNAKPEPGNVDLVQLAPTVQATQSNYLRRHGGRATLHLGWFTGDSPAITHSDSLQTEQGSRFLDKRNRNVMIEVRDSDAFESEELAWCPIDSLLPLLGRDYMINTDARSVLASTPWEVLHNDGLPFDQWRTKGGWEELLFHSFDSPTRDEINAKTNHIASRLAHLRKTHHFIRIQRRLDDMPAWTLDEFGVHSVLPGGLDVLQYSVRTTQREVSAWDQPLMSSGPGSIALVAQVREGLLQFAFVARPEIGCYYGVELGPTLQSNDAHGMFTPEFGRLEAELAAAVQDCRRILSTQHSDEGGRFYQAKATYEIIEVPEEIELPLEDSHVWLNAKEIDILSTKPGIFSNEARSAISMILSFL